MWTGDTGTSPTGALSPRPVAGSLPAVCPTEPEAGKLGSLAYLMFCKKALGPGGRPLKLLGCF